MSSLQEYKEFINYLKKFIMNHTLSKNSEIDLFLLNSQIEKYLRTNDKKIKYTIEEIISICKITKNDLLFLVNQKEKICDFDDRTIAIIEEYKNFIKYLSNFGKKKQS